MQSYCLPLHPLLSHTLLLIFYKKVNLSSTIFLLKFDEQKHAKKPIISSFTQNPPQMTIRKLALVDFLKKKAVQFLLELFQLNTILYHLPFI